MVVVRLEERIDDGERKKEEKRGETLMNAADSDQGFYHLSGGRGKSAAQQRDTDAQAVKAQGVASATRQPPSQALRQRSVSKAKKGVHFLQLAEHLRGGRQTSCRHGRRNSNTTQNALIRKPQDWERNIPITAIQAFKHFGRITANCIDAFEGPNYFRPSLAKTSSIPRSSKQ